MSYKKQELLNLRVHLSGSVLLIYLVFYILLLRFFLFGVLYCNVIYCFRIKTVFGSSLPPVVCRMMSVWVWWCPTHVALCFSSSSVPCVAGFFGLFFFYCPSGIL